MYNDREVEEFVRDTQERARQLKKCRPIGLQALLDAIEKAALACEWQLEDDDK